MEIYAEDYFLINFFGGACILWVTKMLCGCQVKWSRLATGAGLCGAFAFIVFWEGPGFLQAVFIKGLFSIFVILATFGTAVKNPEDEKKRRKRSPRDLLRLLLVFYVVSFFMGGLALGFTYYTKVSYVGLAASAALSCVLMEGFGRMIKRKRTEEIFFCDVKILLGKNEYCFRAMIDTGNFLIEPVSGRPAAIITEKGARRIVKGIKPEKYCVVPYRTIGRTEGIMEGFFSDKITYMGRSLLNVPFAVYKGDFFTGSGEPYDILLNRKCLEGGELL